MTKRDDILDAMAAAFATITIANGYNTDVDTVARVVHDFDEAKPGKLPLVSFGPAGDEAEQITYTPTHRIEVRLRVHVAFHVAARNGVAKQDALSKLRIDILNCVNANHRWGDLAIQTYAVNLETDEAQSHAPEKTGTGLLLFVVEYHEHLTRPT